MELISITSGPHGTEINMSDTDRAESDKENIQNQVETKVVKNIFENTLCQFKKKLRVHPCIKKQKIEEGALKDLKKLRQKVQEKYQALLYDEPRWAGIPKDDYKFMVSENGIPLEIIDLSGRSSHILGNLEYCNIRLNHPTISRYHAIIQYRSKADEKYKPGMSICDLCSSYGTFLNGYPVRPNTYVQITDGDIIRFGHTRRTFVLLIFKNDKKEELKKLEVDIDEEIDQTELPLDDPRSTLRRWFEKERLDLEYKIKFEGTKPFACTIDLPIENSFGKKTTIEVRLCDKEENMMSCCALEACKFLEREYFLKQGTVKNWEERYYSTSSQSDSLDSAKSERGQNNQIETMIQECASLMEKIKKIEKTVFQNKYLTVDPFLNPAILTKLNIRQIKCVLENLRKKEVQLLETNIFFNPPSKSLWEKDLDGEEMLVKKLKQDMTQDEFSALCAAFPANERMRFWENFKQKHNLQLKNEGENEKFDQIYDPLWIFSEDPNGNILLDKSQ